MARCAKCNKFMLLKTQTGYCNDCYNNMQNKACNNTSALSNSRIDSKRQNSDDSPIWSNKQNLHVDTYKEGDTLFLGRYQQDALKPSPVKWHIVRISNEMAFLLADKILDAKQMMFSNVYHDYIDWEKSDLRKWMNNDMLKTMFSRVERSVIMSESIMNSDVYGKFQNETVDRLFVPCLEEYDGLNSDLRTADATIYAQENGYVINFCGKRDNSFLIDKFHNGHGYWWLRSKGKASPTMLVIDDCGELDDYGLGANYKLGVRPAMQINLNKYCRFRI